ncbi:MAG: altronate dehydratase family protein [Bacteroidaceae bacterium]|nr:altronate dehydratase family protein [Bacteroidaceae bacterium]
MMKEYLRINPADNVCVALESLETGFQAVVDGQSIALRSDIPAGHKFALCNISEGGDIIKYGYPIGHATCEICKGGLVDDHNLKTNLSGTLDYSGIKPDPLYSQPASDIAVSSESLSTDGGDDASFLGYERADGQVGIRNDIWVIPTVGCVNGICRQIVEECNVWTLGAGRATEPASLQSPAIKYFAHNYGCSQLGDDHENTRRILCDMAKHPNAGGVLIVGLGCENNQPRDFETLLGDYDRKRIRFLICQEVEGDEVDAGVAIVRELYEQARIYERKPMPVSKLRIGLKCGGSDGFSGITGNPLLGAFTDWLCKTQGGTAILTEVPEMFGAETILMRRAASEEVLNKIIGLINGFKEYFLSHGQPVGENPSPGNKAGGISTLEEKALGCTQKGGSAPVVGVLEYGDTLPSVLHINADNITCMPSADSEADTEPVGGLYLLSAPGNDLVASTALAAAGCQLVLFTTGRGTPFSTFVPTLKVSTNSLLARRKPQWIDFNAGVLVESQTMEEALHDFRKLVIDVACGKAVRAEEAGISEMSIWKNGVTL